MFFTEGVRFELAKKQKPENALRFGFSTHLKSKMYEKTNY